MSIKLLLTGPHVERALTLLALIVTATNPEELARYERQLKALHREQPSTQEITTADPRIAERVAELKAAFDDTAPVERAARLFSSYYPWRAREICTEEGITADQMEKGAVLADQRRQARAVDRAVNGSPEYGRKPR